MNPTTAADPATDPSVEVSRITHPVTDHGRWRLHLALLDASATLVGGLRAADESGLLLDELESIDSAARTLAQQQLTQG